jgi:ectoine hydroxylase-related dioxygenase (phytanoyl-CoA dioxygenase family)/SAM-dependent methyltransferase
MQMTLAARQGELQQLQTQLQETTRELDEVKTLREEEMLLQLSKQRWRGDEPSAGLTWGVPMAGDAFIRFLLDHVSLSQSATVVEIGPGYGRILDAFLKANIPFRRYIGLEISHARVERLRQQFQDPRIEFREADVLAEFELNAVADLTFSSAVFEHLYPDFSAALNTISRFTRQGGAAVIDFIRDDAHTDHKAAWFENETYMRIYSLQELRELFQSSGLTATDLGRISFGADATGREIGRTAVFSIKGGPQVSAEKAFSSASVSSSTLPSFDEVANRTPEPCNDRSLEPPAVPAFRNAYGGLWTDLSCAEAVLAGKTAIGTLSAAESRLLAAWRRDGFVILPKAVPEAAIDAALDDFERAYDGKLGRKISYWDDKGVHIVEATRTHLRKLDSKLLDLHDVSAATEAVIFADPINRFLNILFERPALAFQSLGFYYGSLQELHQDSAFVRVNSPMEFVASWIALEDIKPGSGELVYYPGSHALPHLFGGSHVWLEYDDPQILKFAESLHNSAKEAGLTLQRFIPRKGDVLIWAAGLMHGGGPVTDPNLTRKSLVTHYCPADLQPMFAYKGTIRKRRAVSGNYVMADLL